MDLTNFTETNLVEFPVKENFINALKFSGPLSGPMWEKVNKLNSSYMDDFNWSVYDDLYFKFENKMPNGGVVFKTPLKLVNHHSSCSKCHYSFELDTYGRGCTFNCSYCYAKEQLTKHGYWNRPHPMPVDLAEIRKILSMSISSVGFQSRLQYF